MLIRVLPSLICGLLTLSSAAASAQGNTASLTAACGGAGVDLSLDMSVTGALPPAWTGWVVERMAIGPCEPMHVVFGPEPFPAGDASWSFSDPSALPGLAYKYLVLAVDSEGNRFDLFPPDFTDEWTAVDYAACGGAAVVRGSLHGDPAQAWMFVCGSGCWEFISYVENVPAGVLPFLDTDAPVELRGALHFGPSGPFITDITGWTLLDGCETVAGAPATWSGTKARFR